MHLLFKCLHVLHHLLLLRVIAREQGGASRRYIARTPSTWGRWSDDGRLWRFILFPAKAKKRISQRLSDYVQIIFSFSFMPCTRCWPGRCEHTVIESHGARWVHVVQLKSKFILNEARSQTDPRAAKTSDLTPPCRESSHYVDFHLFFSALEVFSVAATCHNTLKTLSSSTFKSDFMSTLAFNSHGILSYEELPRP